jgi:hypothetical protein
LNVKLDGDAVSGGMVVTDKMILTGTLLVGFVASVMAIEQL